MPQVRAENAMDCHGASKKIPGHSIFFVVHLLYVRYWTRQQASLLPALLYHLRNYITTLFALAEWWSILRMHLWDIKFKITVESEMGKLSRCHLATETSLERVCRACCWCEHKHRFSSTSQEHASLWNILFQRHCSGGQGTQLVTEASLFLGGPLRWSYLSRISAAMEAGPAPSSFLPASRGLDLYILTMSSFQLVFSWLFRLVALFSACNSSLYLRGYECSLHLLHCHLWFLSFRLFFFLSVK